MRIRKYFKIKNILLIIVASAVFYGCSQVPDLSEYQGINYMASQVFDPAIEINWDRDDSNTYHMFTAVIPSTTSGLPAGTTDYSRLEILNLMPDGGFEGGIGSWTTVLPSAGTANVVPGNGTTIHPANQSLYFYLQSDERVYFNLENLSGGITDNANYLIRLNFNSPEANRTVIFEYNDGSSYYPGGIWSPRASVAWTGNSYDQFRTSSGEESLITIKPGANNDFFSIGSITADDDSQEGHIDDVKIVRTDIPLCLRSTVPYKEQGRPELVSGRYIFSIYVKKEDLADINPLTPNRFPADKVTLCINGKPEAIDVSSVTDSQWIKISTEQFIQIYEDDTIELSVNPSDITSPYLKNAGSILIASPALYFISD